ncbi:MAG: methionyl-tRNA formyltransferase, partial [Deltaproteobacteria bacterium]|nr:methionyl-tRNA formyltransferase [Deltaproteobacteria bacterium]
LYLGTPDFAIPPLEQLVQAGHELVAVIAPPGRRAGRGRKAVDPPLALAARSLGLPLLQPESVSAPELLARLAPLAIDVAVTAAYGQYLTPAFLALPRHGVINIHPSLLPRWRGASPVTSALLAGDGVTGVTILRSTQKMDAGPLLAQLQVEIDEAESAGELTARLFRPGGELLLEVLSRLQAGPLPGTPQDESRATLCTKVNRELAEICWDLPATVIARQVRAFNPSPVAWTTLGERQLRIWRARVAGVEPAGPPEATAEPRPTPGLLLGPPRAPSPRVVCGEGLLLLAEVQLEGSRRLPVAEAWHGLRLAEAAVLLGREAGKTGPAADR